MTTTYAVVSTTVSSNEDALVIADKVLGLSDWPPACR